MLSGDLAIYLTGRFVEISMLPLSFREYCEFNQKESEAAFSDYMKYGGMPFAASIELTDNKMNTYLEGIYNTVIVRDIGDRNSRATLPSENAKINDIALLKNISKYLASVVDSPVSVRSISNYIASNVRKISPNTVDDYVDALTEAFIFILLSGLTLFESSYLMLIKSTISWI